MKIVFMGTPPLAALVLKEILEAGHQVTAAVTQPDRPKGRGRELCPSPVKELALRHDIPVLQPRRIKEAEEAARLSEYEADIFVVAAFGQILSKEILRLPRYGCINVHASLLPAYRGAAPIQWAVINGEKETGVTIMQMNEGLDTGDILLQKSVPVAEDETGDSLYDKLAAVGAKLCVEALNRIPAGQIHPVPQDPEAGSYAHMLTKEMGRIDFHKTAGEIERLVRGLNSWPGAYTAFGGKTLKLWKVEAEDEETDEEPGCVCRVEKQYFTVAASDRTLRVLELQPEGRKKMRTADFLLGYPVEKGMMLG